MIYRTENPNVIYDDLDHMYAAKGKDGYKWFMTYEEANQYTKEG